MDQFNLHDFQSGRSQFPNDCSGVDLIILFVLALVVVIARAALECVYIVGNIDSTRIFVFC